MPRVRIREQSPSQRIHNFDEVALGYTPAEAVEEAKRCLGCRVPACVKGCPVGIDIPKFLALIADGNFDEAARAIREMNVLASTCGRVCPQEVQCEVRCVVGKKDEPVAIGRLERFAGDWGLERVHLRFTKDERRTTSDEKVAVIGSGPAGLSCAAEAAKLGCKVTIFESLHAPGGVLVYGIPEFRLPKKILNEEIELIKGLGVDIEVNTLIGNSKTIEELKAQNFKSIFIATGAGLPLFLGIEGENLNGVYSANEFLTRVNLMKGYRFPDYDTPVSVGERAGIIGAGNVAMDAARCAKRLGAQDVYIIYRRTEKEMPARAEEIKHAKEEGIEFMLLTSPVKIVGGAKGWVREIVCQKNELAPAEAGGADESGRRRPVPVPCSEFAVELDTVISAIGNGPNPILLSTMPDLTLSKRGNIVADLESKTSIEWVFAGGDIVTGSATVISAMGQGKAAANFICKALFR